MEKLEKKKQSTNMVVATAAAVIVSCFVAIVSIPFYSISVAEWLQHVAAVGIL